MTTWATIAAATATTIVTSTAALTALVATGFAARAEVAELTGDLAVERVFEAHRHRAARTRTIT